jgi:predicted DNA-binding transcriptional regulator AlpA
VPAPARDHITTEELLAATRSTRDTLYRWVAQKLLPRPRIATDASGRQFAAWVPDALARARFIAASEGEGLTAAEIAVLVEARWPRRL